IGLGMNYAHITACGMKMRPHHAYFVIIAWHIQNRLTDIRAMSALVFGPDRAWMPCCTFGALWGGQVSSRLRREGQLRQQVYDETRSRERSKNRRVRSKAGDCPPRYRPNSAYWHRAGRSF